ncbi:MAG: hypothetical protein LZF60_160142 [Nitrospira sp.]|nr:MAG: hypothetical protein LZF60_160142 [Nitrospira sp.]
MPKPAIMDEIREAQNCFEWSEEEVHGLTIFTEQWIQNEDKRRRLEEKRVAVLKVRKILDPYGPFRYLGNASTEWRVIDRELNECAASLEHFSDEQFSAVKHAKEMVEKHLQRIRNALSIRALEEEVRDCQQSLAREAIYPKPGHMSARDWIVWNIAPFFKHTKASSRKHMGTYAWSDLVGWFDLFGHGVSGSGISKAFHRIQQTTRRDILIARLLTKRLARIQKHSPPSPRKVLHAEARKALRQAKSNF